MDKALIQPKETIRIASKGLENKQEQNRVESSTLPLSDSIKSVKSSKRLRISRPLRTLKI